MADIALAQLPPVEESDDKEEFNGFSDSGGEEEVEETHVSQEALRVLMSLWRRSQCLSHDCTMYHSFALALAVTMTSAIVPSLLKQQIKFFSLLCFMPPASHAFALVTCPFSVICDLFIRPT